ncbi:winged helix-turn-helix domain-containing protein [Yersinia enterocolitica]|uniref:winged helix-turn-helix domain-containing protein n=1 Tax=Yersinia enterocolitica TaxID=630 RepID=UPI000977B6C2|nr:winged helix-turn-helix domain-containing protein [Yersinia enterocolitica]ELI7922725.1 winged helix-turn-helix domain-containing protein [Yersinia enterocolitica]
MSNKCYIINKLAIFYPAERTICSLLKENRIKLNAPTSQLLEAFIMKAGITITQDELYSVAWGDNGSNVTPNTLYQNISLLRRALQDSGIKGDPLTTVRGQGFIFNVSTILEQETTEVSHSELTEIDNSNVVAKRNYILLLLPLLLLFITGYLLLERKETNGDSDDQVFFSSINTCKVFTDKKNSENLNKTRIKKFLQGKLLDCSNYNYAYLHYSDIHPTISLTSCDIDINSNQNKKCKTEIFYNHEKLS